ncbi:MAG: hypothetical protein QUS33_09630, partial [Dehalococcoidia bacterium]|nr:hypothetical protein [Dehalococcoidia bacterium]
MSMRSRITHTGLLLTLCLVIVSGVALTGCGKKKEAALQQPELEFTNYVKGSTVDFDTATLDTMAAGSQANFMYGLAKTIYPSVWDTYKDSVAAGVFPAPYWRGDGVHTYYTYLSSADQGTVDGRIFATKLTAAEQAVVMGAVDSFFSLYADETAAAKPLAENTAYLILYSQIPDSGASANAWKAEAEAWMTALNNYANSNYGGKSYAQLTYVERKTVEGIVFAKGAGTINPEYSFWRVMVKDSFRNGIAAATYPNVAEDNATALYGKSYAALDPCSEKPVVNGAVWASLTAAQRANVTERVAGTFTLATEQVNGVIPNNQNIYYITLSMLADNLTLSDNATQAAINWANAVQTKTPGTSENADFYAQLKYDKPQWISMLSYKYFGTDNYSAL